MQYVCFLSWQNLIGDVKLTETVFEMETEVVNTLDYDDQEEDQRDVRVKRAPVSFPQNQFANCTWPWYMNIYVGAVDTEDLGEGILSSILYPHFSNKME